VPRHAKPAGQQHAQRKSRELAENVIEKKETERKEAEVDEYAPKNKTADRRNVETGR
jgi:hypothetical protein